MIKMKTGQQLKVGYKSGVDGFSGISVTLDKITTEKIEITETVVVNNPTTQQTQTISESVAVVVT